MTELLTRERDNWRVNHGCHLFDVVEQKPVEEHFVGVLQGAQVDVSLKVVVFSFVGLVGADHLFLKAFYVWRQKSMQSERVSFFFRERRSLVQHLAAKQVHSTRNVH